MASAKPFSFMFTDDGAVPASDPVHGKDGPLVQPWRKA
jgi:hypothetical protein